MIYIPPARGPNRITEIGEVGHVRSKIKYQGNQPILGFTPGGNLGVKRKRFRIYGNPG